MKKSLATLLVLVLLVSVTACNTGASANNATRKSIVVTYSVLGSLVKELVGDKANIVVCIPNGADPHEWEPSAKDIEAITRAELVVQNGLGLEEGMKRALTAAQNSGVKFFTAADHVTIRHVGQGEGIPSGDPDQAVGAADPHLWMDPLSMKSVIDELAGEMKRDLNLDVADRANDLEKQLDHLNQQVSDILAIVPQEDRKLVTGHESMGYFAQRYDFKLVGVIVPSLSSQAEVSAGDLAAIKNTIKDNQVKAVFTELGTSPAIVKTIADETGVQVVELSTHVLPRDSSYFTFMKNIATVISGALK